MWRLFSKFFTANFLFWELYVLELKSKVFCWKRTSYIFPWKRDSQCQNSAKSLAQNNPNGSKNFSSICLPQPKKFEFLKKNSLWVSVVRGCTYEYLVTTLDIGAFSIRKYFNPLWKTWWRTIFYIGIGGLKTSSKILATRWSNASFISN